MLKIFTTIKDKLHRISQLFVKDTILQSTPIKQVKIEVVDPHNHPDYVMYKSTNGKFHIHEFGSSVPLCGHQITTTTPSIDIDLQQDICRKCLKKYWSLTQNDLTDPIL